MIHLLSGENSYEILQRLDRVAAGFSGEVERFDGSELSIDMLPDLFMGQTLFATERLIVLRNTSENKSVWSVLSEWLERAGDTDVVLVEAKPDKRSRTYKWLQKNAKIEESKPLLHHEAINWLVQQSLPREVAQFLVEYVGADQWRLQNELQKIKLSGREPSIELVRELVEPTPQATSFELLDAAFARNRRLIEDRLAVVSRSENAQMFFGLLSSQVYALALMQASDGRRPDEIAKSTGVHPYVLQKITALARQTNLEQLRDIVGKLADLDENLKSRSVDPWVQIRSLLLNI